MAKKTIFLDQGEFLGGAERFLIDFLTHLKSIDNRQIDPVLVGTPCPDYQSLISKSDIVIPQIPLEIPSVKGGKLKKAFILTKLFKTARSLIKIVKKEKAHQVFTNTPRTHFVMYLAKKLGLKTRWIVMLHDFTTPNHIIRRIAGQADILIANSLPTRNWLHEVIAEKDQKKIKIVENGVDLKILSLENENTSTLQEIKNITILGRIDPRKGQHHVVEVADLLYERNPDLKFQIIGAPTLNDPKTIKYDEEIQQTAKDRKLTNVKFYGEVPSPFETFAQSDIVLALPTEPETFGRIVIEAMAMGKMILVFDQTGPREIIQSYIQWVWRTHNIKIDEQAFIIENQNTMSLAEKIGYYADTPDALTELTTYMKDFVAENYSLAETTKRMLGLLA